MHISVREKSSYSVSPSQFSNSEDFRIVQLFMESLGEGRG